LSIVTTTQKYDTVAIGGFDGMHIGHKHLFSRLGKNGCIVVIDAGYSNLTPNREREMFTQYPFYYYRLEEIRDLNAQEFITLLSQTFTNLKTIVVGYDFHFGRNRAYGIEDLKTLFSGNVDVVDEVKVGGESVHSRTIRQKLANGDVKRAAALLGYNYTFAGDMIRGQGLGAKELVPTINLQIKEYMLPKEGVYATLTRIDDEEHFHPSVSFLGHRVTTDGSFAVETHILDATVTCKEKAQISFIGFLRENKKFESFTDLKKQIVQDISQAKTVLNILQL
jgi:riboflavin kinase / FMN adenylyltransferase